ncbi:MAG TPA: metallophosphoesterase family protein [Candidatus Methylomirabilis sp.]|nr:metallophosphoesterase family protein [Candidatus Methylomirabilis sp.]
MTRRLVGLISDTHGLLRPETVRRLQGSDLIVHAGDIGKVEVLEALRSVAPVTAVRGNIDKGIWAEGLPTTAAVEIDQVGVYVIHDIQRLDIVPEAAGFTVVVSGHSHHPSIHERNGVIYVNPGSAGPRRFSLPVSIALMHVQDRSVEVKLVTLDG